MSGSAAPPPAGPSRAVAEPGRPPRVWDFREIDFDRLWKGREKTTRVEREIVRVSLDEVRRRRVLEVGPGGGRITPDLLAGFSEYVGVDVTLEFLERLSRRWPEGARWVAADLSSLPVRSGSFDAAVMVRVYNFLVDPVRALRELARVLVPGGVAVMSYFAVPSLATVWDEVQRSLHGRGPGRCAGLGWCGPDRALPTRDEFLRVVRDAGFEPIRSFGVGLEDFRPFRWVPDTALLGMGRAFGPTAWLPHHFAVLRAPGESGERFPAAVDLLQCPDCGIALHESPGVEGFPRACPSCARPILRVGGVMDLRPRVRPPDPESSVPPAVPGGEPSSLREETAR